jgi:hypothetical protein
MKKKLIVFVRGKTTEWSFTFQGDPAHLDDWRADGLQVYEVENSIPAWVVAIGMTRVWVRVQDAWNAIRLF